MKKRNLLFALLLAMTMLVSGCGSSNQTVDGKWLGSMDLTKQFEDGVIAAYPDLAEYVDFDGLVFQMDIAFVDGEMSIDVREDSIETFNTNFAKGMQDIAVGYWEAGLAQINMSLEEAIIESGMTEDAYMERIYASTGINQMIESMTGVTDETLKKLSGMNGTYTTPVAKELRLYYTEEKYEAMEYGFKGNQLNITIKGDSFELLIQCERAE